MGSWVSLKQHCPVHSGSFPQPENVPSELWSLRWTGYNQLDPLETHIPP